MLPREPSYKMRTIMMMMMMMIFSVTPPARNNFWFDQETDPTDYNKHESWKVDLKNISNSDNTIFNNNLYQKLGLFSLKMNLKATGSIST